MNYHGVLDRITDNKGTILVEELGKEFIVDTSTLPVGSKEGSLLTLTIEEGQIENITLDKERTEQAFQKNRDRVNRLRANSKGSRFKRN